MLEGAGPPTLVPRGDAGALAAALEALRADPDRRSRIGATLRQKAVAEYSFETMVERYRELYTRGR
jgi:glycosyltransferase involved in cell wall biosynthesis